MNEQKTVPVTSTLRDKNRSNVSVRTEKTFLSNQQREKYLASQQLNGKTGPEASVQ